MTKEKLIHILNSYTCGLLPEDFRLKVMMWLTDEAHQEETDEALRYFWDRTPTDIDIDTVEQLNLCKQNISLGIDNGQNSSKRRPAWLQYAAMLLLPLLSAFAVWAYMSYWQTNDLALIEIRVPKGETRTITLSDSTHVQLNAGSTLIYPSTFAHQSLRQVHVSGEAYFDVQRDAEHPFIVKAGGVDVRVLGTHFNVKAYPEDKFIVTTLVEGTVNVSETDNKSNQVRIAPHYQAVFNRNSKLISVLHAKTADETAWRKGYLVFSDQSLGEIIRAMERRYGIDINIDQDINTAYTYTMKFTNQESLTEVLDVLCRALGETSYQRRGDTIRIYRKGGGT
ncbi:FecR family protein [Prevotella sp. kh1p2]|uniref:FecR family protein n=1 Tax=Prevotella sp. kh1p2 TaxID=1761883 RepID=UPI0008D52B4E|nr:FecR family protein [Prevotella sp. kh1p2]SES88348.1 FecR family protein [Prevotella sp. kh1p2]SNU12519.1 FecR family protein [Prevotellaceae bacterium KH2P17]